MKRAVFNLLLLGFISALCEATQINEPYCFQYTWLGSMYDNSSRVNITCEDDHENEPCIEPFVVTWDSSPPNTTLMWETQNRSLIGCPLRSGHVCVKYTFLYNNEILNSSSFCGKVTMDAEDPITDGCYHQDVAGYTIEACACRTAKAGDTPCNSSTRTAPYTMTIFSMTIISVLALRRILLSSS